MRTFERGLEVSPQREAGDRPRTSGEAGWLLPALFSNIARKLRTPPAPLPLAMASTTGFPALSHTLILQSWLPTTLIGRATVTGVSCTVRRGVVRTR